MACMRVSQREVPECSLSSATTAVFPGGSSRETLSKNFVRSSRLIKSAALPTNAPPVAPMTTPTGPPGNPANPPIKAPPASPEALHQPTSSLTAYQWRPSPQQPSQKAQCCPPHEGP